VDGQWYEFNDSSVTRCSEPSGSSGEAYALFYRLVGTSSDGGGGGRE